MINIEQDKSQSDENLKELKDFQENLFDQEELVRKFEDIIEKFEDKEKKEKGDKERPETKPAVINKVFLNSLAQLKSNEISKNQANIKSFLSENYKLSPKDFNKKIESQERYKNSTDGDKILIKTI
jgi:predicted transcriptional regulator